MATGPPTSVGGNWVGAYYAEGIVASGKKLLLVAPAASRLGFLPGNNINFVAEERGHQVSVIGDVYRAANRVTGHQIFSSGRIGSHDKTFQGYATGKRNLLFGRYKSLNSV